ncbi:MAG: fimbrillin family protein [Bacteroides sp.]|nr:fimbrillin family protein [Bacteroides sp.]
MKKIFLILATAGLCMTGCSNNEEGLPGEGTASSPTDVIRVTATVNQSVATRAGYEAENLNEFALLIQNSANDAYSYNRKMSKSGDEWLSGDSQQMLWDAARTSVTVTAFAPYEATDFDAILPVSVKSDQSTEDNVKASDFLLTRQTVNPESDLVDGKLKVSMNHALSKLIVKFTVNGTESADVNKVGNLSINGALVDGVCDLAAVTPEVLPATDAVAATVTPYKGEDAYECILLPQTIEEGFSMNFSYDGKLYIWNASQSITLQKGVEHTLTLNINTTSTTLVARMQSRNLSTGHIVEWK